MYLCGSQGDDPPFETVTPWRAGNAYEASTINARAGNDDAMRRQSARRPPTTAGERSSTAGQSPSPPREQASPQDYRSPPYPFYTVTIALALASVVFVLVMLIFKGKFEDTALVTPGLSTLFGIFGTVIGAYFGIKASNDTAERSQSAIEKANQTANRTLAQLPPDVGKQILREE